jgi:hypothetical protein
VTRRRLLDRLVEAPVDIAALVQERLADERWYVQRNMLVLLQRSRGLPAGFSPRTWAMHPDGRVRLEAVRLWLRMPGERAAALECALLDEDTRVVRAGLLDLQQDCPPDWVPMLAGLLADETTDGETRLLAVHALEASRQEEALQTLLQVVDGGRTLLGRPRIPPKSAEVLAALTAQHRSWPADARVAPVLQAAAASPDDDVRAAAGGLR